MFAGLSAASSGILYWGWDLGGFSGDVPDGELYLRAAAASVFVPIMQYHSEFNHHRTPSRDRTPWNIAEQARRTIATSAPLMRPLYFDNPGDENLWEYPLQWMLGDDLLVAPVLEAGVAEWQVYLPEGEWVDAWTGETARGGRVISRPVPIDEIPVYCRAAAWEGMRRVFER